MDLSTEAEKFALRFDWYRYQTKIPGVWFEKPDSLDVRAENVSDFDRLVKNPRKETVVQEPTDDERFLVAAKMAGRFPVGMVGHIEWVEIEEPSEIEQMAGMTGVRNLNFFYNDLEKARYFLGIRGILYNLVDLGDHEQIRVIFDREGNSFSLSDCPMDSFINEMVLTNQAKVLEPRQQAA